MRLLKEVSYWLRGQGLRPSPSREIGRLVRAVDGPHLQKRAWRTFLFIGEHGIEVVKNTGNDVRRRGRTAVPYSHIHKVARVHYDSGIPTDLKFLDQLGLEIARAIDIDPSLVDGIVAQISARLEK